MLASWPESTSEFLFYFDSMLTFCTIVSGRDASKMLVQAFRVDLPKH